MYQVLTLDINKGDEKMQLLGLGWKYNGFTVIAIDKNGITVKMKSVTKQIPLDKVEPSKCEQ